MNIECLGGAKLTASIEVSPKQAMEFDDFAALVPRRTRVYITDIGTATDTELVAGARRLHDLGLASVPHVAARRFGTRLQLETRIRALAEEAGVKDALIIGGGVARPVGDFASTVDVLQTGIFDKFGFTDLGVAGHPEGSPDFSPRTGMEVLQKKAAWGRDSGIRLRIVTQFCFDPLSIMNWIDDLGRYGVELPIHVGVAGPARISTLLNYARICGVGNSIQFIKKQFKSLAALTTTYSPDQVVIPIEQRAFAKPNTLIEQIHLFPFGGIKNGCHWLRSRGSWSNRMQEVLTSAKRAVDVS